MVLAATTRVGNRESRRASLFALALLSKESAVVFCRFFFWLDRSPAVAICCPTWRWRRWRWRRWSASRDVSFRFSDGSFSLHAPFWITWPANYLRILWIWGLVAVAAVWRRAIGALRGAALAAMVWIGIALAPYSFLTYSTRIPSRQTYLASAGLAMLVGLAMRSGGRRARAPAAAWWRR